MIAASGRTSALTEVLCSVIDQPDESKEKKLCLALNRIDGRWDTDKLGDLLRDDDVLEYETGFTAFVMFTARVTNDVEKPDSAMIASEVYYDLATRRIPDTDTTILKFLLDNQPYIKKIMRCGVRSFLRVSGP